MPLTPPVARSMVLTKAPNIDPEGLRLAVERFQEWEPGRDYDAFMARALYTAALAATYNDYFDDHPREHHYAVLAQLSAWGVYPVRDVTRPY